MSSHHFVKEDQEPALLILDPDAIAFEKIQELLEWSPLVIVAHSAIEKVLLWGIKIDVVLTSNSSEPLTQIISDQIPLKIINFTSIENRLEHVCQFLINRKQTNLNVVTNNAQALFAAAAKGIKRINVVLFEGQRRWCFVEDGSYSKWLPKDATLIISNNKQEEQISLNKPGLFSHNQSESFWIGEEY